MKKIYFSLVASVFALVSFAQNNVTFQVDMKNQTVSGSVYVAGSFNSWNGTGNSLTQVGSSTIYAATVSIPAGITEFKFINGTSWENVPDDCAVNGGYGAGNGNSNRWVSVWSDTTLPAVLFEDCAPDGMASIQFMVDMSTQTTIEDTVSVAGSFQGWSPGATIMSDVVGDSVYRAMGYVNTGDTVQFKYINGTTWAQNENVPSACQYAGSGNRGFVVSSNMNAGPVCFNMCASCFIPDTSYVTVQIDASNICDTVTAIDIAGPFNGWAGGDTLSYNSSTGYYEITVYVPEDEFEYKARYFTANSGPNWEGVANTVIQFNDDTIVTPRCYNVASYGPCVPKPAPADITFRVDFAQAGVTPAAEIFLIGDFTGWQGGAIKMTPMSGNPGVYETTINDFCPPTLAFKFVNGDVNTTSNEEGLAGSDLANCGVDNGNGGYNRVYTRPDGMDRALQFIWDSCEVLTIGLDEQDLAKEIEIYPNPFSTEAVIDLGSEFYAVRMMDIAGRIVYAEENQTGSVTIYRNNMSPGVYILTATNNKGVTRTSKFIVE